MVHTRKKSVRKKAIEQDEQGNTENKNCFQPILRCKVFKVRHAGKSIRAAEFAVCHLPRTHK